MARTKPSAKRTLKKTKHRIGRKKVIRGYDEIPNPEARGSRVTRSSEAQDIPDVPAQRFKDPNHKKIYNKRSGTPKIAQGRIVDFNSLDNNKAEFVREWFQGQSLNKLMEEKDLIYPDLVRQFYTHFDKNNEEEVVIQIWVKGREIVLNDKKLGEILGIPAIGVHDSTGKKWSTHEAFDKEKCIKLVLMDQEAKRESKPLVDDLPMPTRLLHLILNHTFISREGRMKSSMTFLDLFVMHCILSEVRVNMLRMIPHLAEDDDQLHACCSLKQRVGAFPTGCG